MGDRLGLRGRLLLAFVGISAFSVLAAITAVYSFLEIGGALQRITQDRMPATVASQKLSRQAERLAAAAPSLLTAASATKHERISAELFADFERLQALLATLSERDVDRSSLILIESLVERLSINLRTLDTMVFNNLVLIERRKEMLRQLRFNDIAARRVLTPGLLVMDAKLAELRQALESPSAGEQSRVQKIVELAGSLTPLTPLQGVHMEVSAINDMLIEAASAASLADLGVLDVSFRRSRERLEDLLGDVESDVRARLDPHLLRFREFTDGPNSIVAARQKELRHRADMEILVAQNVDISRQLTDEVDRLVSRTNLDIRNADAEALSVQRTSTTIMITVVVLSLGCSALIVWLYVGRSIIARLTGLSDSMLAIAGGNLEKPITVAGPDEIGEMAKALVIFRDTAIEIRDTNLREIRQARQRLIDAIESISEGFSLYDADDRLVLCNSRYRQNLYPGLAGIMVPGTPFATVIRSAAERGLISGAEEQAEQWIAERLEAHRHPSGPVLQHQSDGRWFRIDERKTEDGGTVAVYADITDLKNHEQALAEKSNTLEQLAAQLSKYLAPQVYSSIFSGKQEVKVASSRKKLTVFFSDIVGFTEMTDSMESEELTGLLNKYLTEMSRIALDHGATIDKYMGDGILVFFGAPETRGVREDALACVKMAVAMREKLHDLTHIWRESGVDRPLQVRMGISTGFCTVGNFGSEDRVDYTIIGRGVNTAARLESIAPPGEILVSYETFAHVKDELYCEERGEIEIKGISRPVATYRVVDCHKHLGTLSRRFSETHQKVKVDLDLDSMTADDRQRAADILRRALDALARGDQPLPMAGARDK